MQKIRYILLRWLRGVPRERIPFNAWILIEAEGAKKYLDREAYQVFVSGFQTLPPQKFRRETDL